MITVIKDKELGNIEIITQQYASGLYVAIYKNKRLINQCGSDLKELHIIEKFVLELLKEKLLLLKEMLSKLKVNIQ